MDTPPFQDMRHPPPPSPDRLLTLTHVMYGLHALSALAGLLTAAFVVTAFVFSWPSIIAVIINYVKRSAVRDSWLDSHFGWQLRTFWFALLWITVSWLLFLTVIGAPLAFLFMLGTGIWVLYRIGRGWLALTDRKTMPSP